MPNSKPHLSPRSPISAALLLTVTLTLAASGCKNAGTKGVSSSTSTTSGGAAVATNNGATPTPTPAPVAIQSVTLSATTILVNFNAALSTNSIGSRCALTTNPCVCEFSWTEINNTSGTAISIARKVQKPVTAAEANRVTCSLPSAYAGEVLEGTTVSVEIKPTIANPDQFTITATNFVKGNVNTTGSYVDAQGRSLENIVRYACFDQGLLKGTAILNKATTVSAPAPSTESATFPISTRWCVRTRNNPNPTSCPVNIPQMQPTSESYYFNFYIRDRDRGNITEGNSQLFCPRVAETINASIVSNFYPLDRQFSLISGPSPEFSIGVEAYLKPAQVGDKIAGCSTNVTARDATAADRVTSNCLGWAAKPNLDGSCPAVSLTATATSAAITIQTYRLRRYVAIYPPRFDAGGNDFATFQPLDVIYVVDRPVYYPANPTPTKPYTIQGAKPCPWAWYDKNGVRHFSRAGTSWTVNAGRPLNAAYPNKNLNPKTDLTGGIVPSYAGTLNADWDQKNVDGLAFPHKDWDTNLGTVAAASCTAYYCKSASCAATFPVLNNTSTQFSLYTPDAPVFVRPIRAWAPKYEEDVAFQACAPLANPVIDPPLHFARDASTEVTYCAEVYPTQADRITALDSQSVTTPTEFGAQVIPFTSHLVKGNDAGNNTACTATALTLTGLPYTYPAAGAARHTAADNLGTYDALRAGEDPSLTCDRTVNMQNLSWSNIPLLAPAADVEATMTDTVYGPQYRCSFTYGTSSSAGLTTPSGGCYGSRPGGGAIEVLVTPTSGTTTAHHKPASCDPAATTAPTACPVPTR